MYPNYGMFNPKAEELAHTVKRQLHVTEKQNNTHEKNIFMFNGILSICLRFQQAID
jgi:hypothetical protein